MADGTYTMARVAEATGGRLVQGDAQSLVSEIFIDSRRFTPGRNALFIALQGPRHNANMYAAELYRLGQRHFVLSSLPANETMTEATIVLVDSGLRALQQLAKAHRSQYHYPVIAITGSNAKTIIKEWLYQLLHSHIHVVRSPRSYNSQVGVPLSVWLMRAQHQLAILEAGISMPGEMERLQPIIAPTMGIFTNLGDAHAEHFDSPQTKAAEKMKLFIGCQKLLYCRDHPLVHEAALTLASRDGTPQLISWSLQRADATLLIDASTEGTGTRLNGSYRGDTCNVWIPFTHPASVENTCHCWLALLELGIDQQAIAAGLASLAPIAMRLEFMAGINGCTLVNDTYNSDPASLAIALDYLVRQGKNKTRTAILSDIAQSGEPPETLYPRVADMLRAYSVTRLLGVGPEMGSRAGDFSGLKATFYESTAALLENLPTLHFEREDILIKGARTFTFEAITERLEEKTHETALEIDLNRITDNLNQLRNLLNPGTRVMAMVKAFAYGTGSYEVARLLEHHRVDYLAVAYADEGVALRKAGIHLPILVLNPEHTAYPAMIEHRLEPQLYNFRTVHHFAKALEHAAVGVRYPVHIKVNTGMNRLGFDPENLTDLVALLKNAELAMEVRSVFSHLAASEDPGSDTLTKLQIERFRHAAAYIETGIGYPFMKHILNSGGAMRHPEAQMDMVRLGIALYGISSHPDARSTLKPAGTLVTTISQLRNVPAGEGVGYAPRTPLSEARTIAVLPIGYADGLPRAMGNGAWKVYIHGQPAPTVGHICMDMCMVDVTHLKCNEGDRVEVLGEQATIYEMARVLNTIPYEILTHISPRVKRVYLHE